MSIFLIRLDSILIYQPKVWDDLISSLTIKRNLLFWLVTLSCNSEVCRKDNLWVCAVKKFCSFDFSVPRSITATYLLIKCVCLFWSSLVLSQCTAKLLTLHFFFPKQSLFSVRFLWQSLHTKRLGLGATWQVLFLLAVLKRALLLNSCL